MDIVSIGMLILIAYLTFGGSLFIVLKVGVSLVSPVATILFFSFFYLSGWIFHISLSGETLSKNDSLLLFIPMSFLLVFLIGALKKPSVYSKDKKNGLNPQKAMLTGYILFFIGILLYALIFIKNGSEFYLSSKGYRNLMYTGMGVEKFAKDFLIPSLILLNYYYTKKRRVYSKYYILVSVIMASSFILLEVRSALAIQIITFLYFYDRHIKNIKLRYLLIIYILLFFSGGMAKELFYHLKLYILGGEFSPSFSLVLMETLTKHEFFAWFEIFQNLSTQLVYGETIFRSIASFLFPGFLGGEAGYSPTTWYVKEYLPEIFDQGFGRGFSFIVELYINFTIVGMLLSAFYIGRFLRALDESSYYYIAAFFTGIFPFIWTGNSAVFLKQYFAIYFLPAFIIYWSLKFLIINNTSRNV